MWGRGDGEGGRGNSHSAVHDWQLTDRCCWVVGNPVYLWISGKVDMPSLMYVSPSSRNRKRAIKSIGADGKFSDLNVFLLLVLQAASSSPSLGSTGRRDRRSHVIELLRGGGKVPISSVCSTYHLVHRDES
jgi:hypothetical protein